MTKLLLRLFVKDYKNLKSPDVRSGVGILSGAVGICCNLLLCILKLIVGTVSGAVSIMADALNNMSDAVSSVVTLIGFKLAKMPADEDHPYGHARAEYLSGLAVAVLILFIGFELAQSSVEKIFRPEPVHFSSVAIAILLLSLFRVKVKIAMAVSILVALPISLLVQQTPVSDLPRLLVMGFQAADSDVAAMVNGGGIISMVRVSAIVSLSSSYSGIFKKTGLLDGAKRVIGSLADRVGPYTATLCTATLANMIACNQTLGIMLTHQLCRDIQDDPEAMALNLEDSAVVVAPLVPWSIAGAVSLSAAGAPMTGIVAAWYLYLLPLWRLTVCAAKKRK